ncbi:Protein-tyrosine-phosphatase MKP1 [Heracleum sosnowskyi]|uniref:Protein-tyrosine-phosphatase MKP1 n=1 Tax=Heracleum sosnowskyi TaxID=360622 RepID=A0AAD8LWB2_9APIA|nr:Protein-tyrosine-phosphatase MKP1 [Heracleum sosnowskyi]KAK1376609.1 Protein-tyrosine-phosphatase MKP1 [Heracleum sosnowskyi]
MLRVEDNADPSGGYRKMFSGSGSWTDGSPVKAISRPRFNSKARGLLLPLQPLSISRPKVEEWPTAGSDDLGVWPYASTPGVRRELVKIPGGSLGLGQSPREFESEKGKLAFFENVCSKITDHIYLGSDAIAKNREVLKQNGITHVLNCVGFICPEYFKGDLKYLTLWLRDSPSEDITSILYDVFDYFEDVREQGGRVFVHCSKGVSRSNSLVIAYLMWREKLSFEDAFQRVKAARGVTNPNMGFACQLLQFQKRVHAMPASPVSVLRMYRMAPHSENNPVHLVPKLLSNPGADNLDSRGAFVVCIPAAIYVWVGKNCVSVMSDNARIAALQVIRYEKAQVSVLTIREGEETSEFWKAIGTEQVSVDDDCHKAAPKRQRYYSTDINKTSPISPGGGERNVKSYDADFEIFRKALYGEFVPPALFRTGSETPPPARENRWGQLKWKFAEDAMKKLITPSKSSSDIHGGVESSVYHTDLSPVSSPGCDSYKNEPFTLSSPSSNGSEFSVLSAQPSPT